MTISLHIFTNCCKINPLSKLLQTYESFCDVFGKIEPVVWIDPHPKRTDFEKYVQDLSLHFKDLRKCQSLSDGYIKAIKQSQTDWIFSLEHDWQFIKSQIHHSLDELTEIMAKHNIYHLRFNKKKTLENSTYDRFLKEYEFGGWKFCMTPFLSNNPHILNRKVYIEFINNNMIEIRPKSHGIEEVISQYEDTRGIIYGPKGYDKCIHHLDGRGKYKHRR